MPKKPLRPREPELKLRVIVQREMTDAEVEGLAKMLFDWWRLDYEAKPVQEQAATQKACSKS